MNISLFVEVKGNIDSLMLWDMIKDYKLNLTALEDKTWIYGETNYTIAGKVISKCALFGNTKAELTHRGGGADEQKKAQDEEA